MTRPTKVVRQMNLRKFIIDILKQRLTEAGFRTIRRHTKDKNISCLYIHGFRKKHKIELIKQQYSTFSDLKSNQWILSLHSERMLTKYHLCAVTDTDLAAPGSFEKIIDNIISFLQKMQKIDIYLEEAHGIFENSMWIDRRGYDPNKKTVNRTFV